MRTFVAVDISDKRILEGIKDFQDGLSIDARPTDVKNMHFTLLFLGEISESVGENVKKALKEIVFESFSLSFEKVGVFPNPKYPRVIWIGTGKGQDMIKNLALKVEAALNPLGFKNARPFMPHVTIFRIKNKVEDITKDLKQFQDTKFGIQQISQIKLKQSTLTRTGSLYSDLLEVSAVQ